MSSAQWEENCFMRTDGRTDRHHEASSRFSQFFERVQKPAFQSADITITFKAGLSPIHCNCTAATTICLVPDIINEACAVNSPVCTVPSKINIS